MPVHTAHAWLLGAAEINTRSCRNQLRFLLMTHNIFLSNNLLRIKAGLKMTPVTEILQHKDKS